ncbi:MAG: dockerin type I domain-containing protein [Defluviitaleaceae bacterium]|nr:dockerin type I domain-containing protein [Defluviitaleaceae bacterium]
MKKSLVSLVLINTMVMVMCFPLAYGDVATPPDEYSSSYVVAFNADNEITLALLSLQGRIDSAKELLRETLISTDGKDILSSQFWVTQQTYFSLANVVKSAQAMLSDYQLYSENFLEIEGVRVSQKITRVSGSENLIDVTLSLDLNPGIGSLTADVLFDEDKLTPVLITDEGGLNEFTTTTSSREGGIYTNRRMFSIMRVDSISHETGVIGTVRFMVNDGIDQILPVALACFDVAIRDTLSAFDNTVEFAVLANNEVLELYGLPVYENEIGAFSSSPNSRYLLGDITGNGTLTAEDARLLARYVAKHQGIVGYFGMNRADANRDGVINAADCTYVLRLVLGEKPRYLNMEYRILSNTAGGQGTLSQAEGIMNDVSRIFSDTFKVDLIREFSGMDTALNIRQGCSVHATRADVICDARCGAVSSCATSHHRSARWLLGVLSDSTRNINTFRFVNYALCGFDSVHRSVGGSGNESGVDMIATLHGNNGSFHRVIVLHEISHMLGAVHCNAVDTVCIMKGNATDTALASLWCARCEREIKATIDRIGRPLR